MNKYQTIILELNDIPEKKYFDILKEEGSLWVITQHSYNKECDMKPYEIIKHFNDEDFVLKNIILWYIPNDNENSIINARYRYVFLFAKSNAFFFNKDPIREKHKWAKLDWGKRPERYHPLGKDPGNLWVKEVFDDKATTIEHTALSKKDVFQRIVLCSSNDKDKILIVSDETIDLEKRDITHIKQNKVKITSNIHSKNQSLQVSVNENVTSDYKIHFQSSENMKNTISDKSIQTVVTSPPYWDLKNYKNHDKQIGYKEGYEEYHERMNAVWTECYRVLKDDGNMFVNVNTLTKNKEMILIQEDIIRNMQKIGFILKDVIMWNKPSGIPNKHGLSDRFEYIMWFVKDINKHKVYNVEFKRDYLISGIHTNGNMWRMFRKAGNIAKKLDHPAIYPNELVERCVLLTTEEGDIVLDPFLGSGTSLIATLNLNRSFVGFEINTIYQQVIEHRIKNELNK